jgi:hypothetical protein
VVGLEGVDQFVGDHVVHELHRNMDDAPVHAQHPGLVAGSPSLPLVTDRSTTRTSTYAMSSYTGQAIGPMMSGKFPSQTHMGWKHYRGEMPRERNCGAARPGLCHGRPVR